MDAFRRNYEVLKTQWGGYAGYDLWVAKANNASFGAQAAYDELVPQFEALYARQGSWQKFYDACKALAKLPREQRRAALAQQAQQSLTNAPDSKPVSPPVSAPVTAP